LASPLLKIFSPRLRSELAGETNAPSQVKRAISLDVALFGNDLLESLPCVVYECNESLKISLISPNAFDLIGIRPRHVLGTRAFWDSRILREDLELISDRLNELDKTGSASLMHRVINDAGLPVWVAHSYQKVGVGDVRLRGCMIPMRDERSIQDFAPGVISRFIHKIGNHFQLLNLVVDACRKGLPETKESALLQESIEKAIEFTRVFSDYSQVPTWLSDVDPLETLTTAIVTRKSLFAAKGVALEDNLECGAAGLTLQGDPFLLEMAIGSILQNALEATDAGGKVVLHASVAVCENNSSALKFSVVDNGCGIEKDHLDKVFVPFYTSKKDHEGLGLSMAVRFIGMHGGVITIDSQRGKGTVVSTVLPAGPLRRLPDL
jgi:signal transduction histidine kinase